MSLEAWGLKEACMLEVLKSQAQWKVSKLVQQRTDAVVLAQGMAGVSEQYVAGQSAHSVWMVY